MMSGRFSMMSGSETILNINKLINTLLFLSFRNQRSLEFNSTN